MICNVRAFGRFDLVPNPFQDFGVGAINPGVILSPFHIFFAVSCQFALKTGSLSYVAFGSGAITCPVASF